VVENIQAVREFEWEAGLREKPPAINAAELEASMQAAVVEAVEKVREEFFTAERAVEEPASEVEKPPIIVEKPGPIEEAIDEFYDPESVTFSDDFAEVQKALDEEEAPGDE
jgi:hypothetical protein